MPPKKSLRQKLNDLKPKITEKSKKDAQFENDVAKFYEGQRHLKQISEKTEKWKKKTGIHQNKIQKNSHILGHLQNILDLHTIKILSRKIASDQRALELLRTEVALTEEELAQKIEQIILGKQDIPIRGILFIGQQPCSIIIHRINQLIQIVLNQLIVSEPQSPVCRSMIVRFMITRGFNIMHNRQEDNILQAAYIRQVQSVITNHAQSLSTNSNRTQSSNSRESNQEIQIRNNLDVNAEDNNVLSESMTRENHNRIAQGRGSHANDNVQQKQIQQVMHRDESSENQEQKEQQQDERHSESKSQYLQRKNKNIKKEQQKQYNQQNKQKQYQQSNIEVQNQCRYPLRNRRKDNQQQ